MLKWIRRVGSLGFVIGFFAVIFAVIPWYVTVVDSSDVGGHLPSWVQCAVYLLVGGIAVVLVTVAIEQGLHRPKPVGQDRPRPCPPASCLRIPTTSRDARWLRRWAW